MPTPKPKLRTLVVDDSPQARRLLRLMIAEHLPQVEIVAESADANEALTAIEAYKPEVMLLDIEMPEKSGLQLAQELAQHPYQPTIIFTTAYSEYAIQAFRLSALDYLLKPIQEPDLIQAFEKVQQQQTLLQDSKRLQTLANNLNAETPQSLCLPVLGGYEYVALSDIEYLEADGAYVHVVLASGKTHIISKNLKYFENLLKHSPQFVRVHRSYIVNTPYVQRLKKGDRPLIWMQSGKEISLAKERKQDFLNAMG
ncbi:LytR/AlgR family response regulator transcription factor [Eisenibacter elegans]|jgi:two-component system LytT family response regulator|uniref:LytR/AlgR family response regulator transcription factor n=1 Tax=Eisenibacter elegans TaxID=997 RepID=UPI0004232FBA|nr:LytTR family DNA-binding domain-containing protein [Eisenibacter elegans]